MADSRRDCVFIIDNEFGYRQKPSPIALIKIDINTQEGLHRLVHSFRRPINLWVVSCGEPSLDAENFAYPFP